MSMIDKARLAGQADLPQADGFVWRNVAATTERIDRAGDIVRSVGGDFTQFHRNPAVLLKHGMVAAHPHPWVGTAPGKFRPITVPGSFGVRGLANDIHFFSGDLGGLIGRLAEIGVAGATSIGFQPKGPKDVRVIGADGEPLKRETDDVQRHMKELCRSLVWRKYIGRDGSANDGVVDEDAFSEAAFRREHLDEGMGLEFIAWHLLEWSVVPVPMNSDAVPIESLKEAAEIWTRCMTGASRESVTVPGTVRRERELEPVRYRTDPGSVLPTHFRSVPGTVERTVENWTDKGTAMSWADSVLPTEPIATHAVNELPSLSRVTRDIEEATAELAELNAAATPGENLAVLESNTVTLEDAVSATAKLTEIATREANENDHASIVQVLRDQATLVEKFGDELESLLSSATVTDPSLISVFDKIRERIKGADADGIEAIAERLREQGDLVSKFGSDIEGAEIQGVADLASQVASQVAESCAPPSGAIPHWVHPLADEGAAWNGPAEAKAADVDDLRAMAAWMDVGRQDVKTSYRLVHHRQSEHRTVWAGVKSAMGSLLGARGGVNIPHGDRQKVYDHLAAHYREFGQEPPEFREYTRDQIRALFPELAVTDGDLSIFLRETVIGACVDCGAQVPHFLPRARSLMHNIPSQNGEKGKRVCGGRAVKGDLVPLRDAITTVELAVEPPAMREHLLRTGGIKLPVSDLLSDILSRAAAVKAALMREGHLSAEEVFRIMETTKAAKAALAGVLEAASDSGATTPTEASEHARATVKKLATVTTRLATQELSRHVDAANPDARGAGDT